MKPTRIIERIGPDGEKTFVIQQKHGLFRWQWVDAWVNYGPSCKDSFKTFDEAFKHLCFFDGTENQERVVFQK